MNLKLCFISGCAFATVVCFCVFGKESKAILNDPYGDNAAIELQINMLKADSDSSNVATITILDTINNNNN